MSLSSRTSAFDVIFFDPPWDADLIYRDGLSLIFEQGLLRPSACLICEHFKKKSILDFVSGYNSETYSYGDTALTVITND